MTLGLAVDDGPARPGAPRRGRRRRRRARRASRTYTYAVPETLADLEVGRGRPGRVRPATGARRGPRRQRRGPAPGVTPKPILERVRADGPLLPPLTLTAGALDRRPLPRAAGPRPPGDAAAGPCSSVSSSSPSAARADRRDIATSTPVDLDLLEQLDGRPRRARDLAAPDGRAGLLRRLRALATRDLIDARLDAPRRLGRAALRALGPAHARRSGRGASGRGRRATRGSTARASAAGPRCSRRWPGRMRSTGRRPRASRPARQRPRSPGSSGAACSRSRSGSGRDDRWRHDRPGGAVAGRRPRISLPAQAEAVDAGRRRPWRARDRAAPPRRRHRRWQDGDLRRGDRRRAGGRPAGRSCSCRRSRWRCPLVDRLRADLDARIALVHSGLGDGERADEWRRIRAARSTSSSGRGSRSWRRSPTSGWSSSTRSTTPPTRATGRRGSRPATRRSRWAELAGAAVVLGFGDARGRQRRPARGWARTGATVLPGRPSGQLADGRGRRPAGRARRGQARAAVAAARGRDRWARPGRGEQAILVLNRRGSASVVLCRDCGHVQACPDCERPLVYHQAGTTLRCHHCGRATPLATRCPTCASPRIRYLGGGTERVEREVRERFPDLRVGRLDRDVVERRGAAARVLDAFARAGSTCSSARASSPRASTSRR